MKKTDEQRISRAASAVGCRACMRILTRSSGAVTVLAIVPAAAPAAKSAALLGTSASSASGWCTSCAAGGSLRSVDFVFALSSTATKAALCSLTSSAWTTTTSSTALATAAAASPPSRTESEAKAGIRGPARRSGGAPAWFFRGGRHESQVSPRRRLIGDGGVCLDLRARGSREAVGGRRHRAR